MDLLAAAGAAADALPHAVVDSIRAAQAPALFASWAAGGAPDLTSRTAAAAAALAAEGAAAAAAAAVRAAASTAAPSEGLGTASPSASEQEPTEAWLSSVLGAEAAATLYPAAPPVPLQRPQQQQVLAAGRAQPAQAWGPSELAMIERLKWNAADDAGSSGSGGAAAAGSGRGAAPRGQSSTAGALAPRPARPQRHKVCGRRGATGWFGVCAALGDACVHLQQSPALATANTQTGDTQTRSAGAGDG